MKAPGQKVKLGREARARLSALLSERVEVVLTALTRDYRGGTMTPDKALCVVAELASLEDLARKIDREAQEEARSDRL